MSEKKGNKVIMIILIVLLMLAIGAATFFGYSYLNKSNSKKEKKVIENTVSVDEIIINLADEDTKAYLKAKINLGYTKKNADKNITLAMPQIRDRINTYLRTKKSTDFEKDGLNKIRQDLLNQINDIFDEPLVTNVYFYEIILQ